jgi:hypothetical protein
MNKPEIAKVLWTAPLTPNVNVSILSPIPLRLNKSQNHSCHHEYAFFSFCGSDRLCRRAPGWLGRGARRRLGDGLVSYWPLEEVQGAKTPDLVSGYNMDLNNLTASDLVAGKVGKCFSFANARQTLLSRVHGPNDDLPNKHSAFTVAFEPT